MTGLSLQGFLSSPCCSVPSQSFEFADPDTSRVLKMEFLGSWKSQIKEVMGSQRARVINMLGALEGRGII